MEMGEDRKEKWHLNLRSKTALPRSLQRKKTESAKRKASWVVSLGTQDKWCSSTGTEIKRANFFILLFASMISHLFVAIFSSKQEIFGSD